MIDLALDLLVAALMLLAIYGLGRLLWRLVCPLLLGDREWGTDRRGELGEDGAAIYTWSRSADLAYTFALGLGAAVTLLFALALVGWLRPLAGWLLLVDGILLAGWQRRSLLADLRALAEVLRWGLAASWFVKSATLIALAFALINLTADLAPPIEGDTVHQYLLVPRYWVEAGRYVQPTHIWASTLPGNMMVLSAWALLLRPSYSLATLVTGLGMSALLALSVYALARLHYGRGVAALAAIAIYTVPDVGYLAQSAKVDMGWAFFETLALAAFLRGMYPTPERRWLALAGICLGLAAGSKNQTLISIGLLGGWIVLRQAARRDWCGLLLSALAFGGATLATGFPYYLYNALAHRNPFYPVFADLFVRLFGATPSPRSELGTEVFYPWTISGYFANLWNASLGHTRPGFYLGFIAGPLFLLTIPIGWGLGLLRGERPAWRMMGYAFIFSIVWFLVKQAVRHFLPGLVLLAVVTALVLWKINQQPTALRRAMLAIVILALGWNLMTGVGVLYWSGAYRVALGLESREAFLRRFHDRVAPATTPDWETIGALNVLVGAQGRVFTVHASSPLYIAPDLVSANWGDRAALGQIADPQALFAALKAQGIGYMLVYRADEQGALAVDLPAFLRDYAEVIYAGPRALLYQLREAEG